MGCRGSISTLIHRRKDTREQKASSTIGLFVIFLNSDDNHPTIVNGRGHLKHEAIGTRKNLVFRNVCKLWGCCVLHIDGLGRCCAVSTCIRCNECPHQRVSIGTTAKCCIRSHSHIYQTAVVCGHRHLKHQLFRTFGRVAFGNKLKFWGNRVAHHNGLNSRRQIRAGIGCCKCPRQYIAVLAAVFNRFFNCHQSQTTFIIGKPVQQNEFFTTACLIARRHHQFWRNGIHDFNDL